MSSLLYFHIGETKGFTAIDLADKKVGYANPIRELLQNSLDASREAGNDCCEIAIHIKTIAKSQVPHIDKYEEVLDKAIKTAENQNSYNANSKQRVKPIRAALKQNDLDVLMFVDNGTGMNQQHLDAILTGGVSIKDSEGAGGSFGVGNLSSYSLSDLRCVLYATKYKDAEGKMQSLFTGSPILAGYDDGNALRGNRGRIILKKPANEAYPKFQYPQEFPNFIREEMECHEQGTMVAILALSEDWSDEAEYAIASNFFHAIAHDGLRITVDYHGQTKTIENDAVASLLANKKENQRATGESILSGKAVYQAWQTVMDAGSQKEINLANNDKVHVYIKNDIEANSTIVLIRNGMVIARHDSMLSNDMDWLRKDSRFESFTAVIDVDQHSAPKLFKLVKGAENPYHNQLQKGILSVKDEKQLKLLFKELSKAMQPHLKQIERNEVVLPLFPITNERGEKVNPGESPRGQNNIAKPRRASGVKPKPNTGKGKKRPVPDITSRILPTKTAMRYAAEDGQWQVFLRITPTDLTHQKTDDVYLSIWLAEDNDHQSLETPMPLASVEVNKESIKMSANNAVKLPVLTGKQSAYDVRIVIKKHTTQKMGLVPILGLRKRKGANHASTEKKSEAGGE